jgi:hypothetical protein
VAWVDPTFVIENLDRIGAYALLMAGIWALITGRLITAGRLDDHKELIRMLREENAELRAAVEKGNDAQAGIRDQMEDVNRLLARLVDEPPRRAGRAT